MENPEEVLQALDEFQKMRPSEIPRELEEYLCWVAKTGDPVYQWPLIKALFREKLARVMTELYENCPNIDVLSACPNVEHFNYDSMKSSLLERLESFANAPFTVQRICELLTSPRKEYNRVDKFMRAIEKNILVVSTREPGPNARPRSENGEGMVNGSLDDQIPQGPQSSDEMEVETWVKDCGSATSLPLHPTSENDLPQLTSSLNQNTSVVKQLSSVNGSSKESPQKFPQSGSDADNISPSFVSSSSEFIESSNSDSSVMTQESLVHIGHIGPDVHDSNTSISEVPEAIINEDTSSQPSLDLENDEAEPIDPSRKLQTTFQAKDFISSYKKNDSEENNEKEKSETKDLDDSAMDKHQINDETNDQEEDVSNKSTETNEEAEGPKEEVSEQTIILKSDYSESTQTTSCESSTDSTLNEEEEEEVEEEEEDEVEGEKKKESEQTDKEIMDKPKIEDERSQETLECAEVLADVAHSEDTQENSKSITIEEITEENSQAKSLVPDPIPIIEEPKENVAEPKKWENVSVIESSEGATAKIDIVPFAADERECEPPKKVLLIDESTKEVEQIEKEDKVDEAMEVDSEESQTAEPMEQETSESVS